MAVKSNPVSDPGDPRIMTGSAWDGLAEAVKRASRLVLGEGVPDTPRDRAEGFRYLTRFLAAGIANCVAHDDPDHPVFGRMIDYSLPWGLDCPDCLYLYAGIRGDATYRIHGARGSAHHIDIQVNYGHFASGDIASWGTIASLDGFDLDTHENGEFELVLSAGERPSGAQNWLPLASNAEFLLVRQYFNDWENEEPADLLIERQDGGYPVPPPTSAAVAARIEKLTMWLEKGGALWENMSRGLLGMEPNTLAVHLPQSADERAGMRGQAYGMGNFRCAPDEAVIVEFKPPVCHHWSVSLANWWWEAIEFGSRQSSLNGHQAVLDQDGVFRGVIAHADPGVANWLDPAGHSAGTIAARFLRADAAPTPRLRAVPVSALADQLPAGTARVERAERERMLERRRRAVVRRYRV